MMSPETDHPTHIRRQSLLRGKVQATLPLTEKLTLLTLDNFPDVKLHVEIWIFAGVAIVYHHHQ